MPISSPAAIQPISIDDFGAAAKRLAELGCVLYARGWLSATSGNLSVVVRREPLQLAIIEDKAEYHANLSQGDLAERERSPVPFHVLINPQIHLVSQPEIAFFEGCLSLPGFTGIVPRARLVLVEALDHLGQPVRIEATGWYARILQHEIDHLRGTLYIDRMWSGSFSSLENYNRHWKSKTTTELRLAFENRS